MSSYNDFKYEISLRDEEGVDITTGALTLVYDSGTKTISTLYSDGKRTALANPVTRTVFGNNGAIVFYSAKEAHDIVIWLSDGSRASASVTPTDHLVVVNKNVSEKVLVAEFGASDNTETDTAVDFPLDVHITDARIYVITADATETLDVGLLSSETAGDANGLLSLASVANTGWVAPAAATTGSNEQYLSAVTYGALMGSFLAGSDVATDTGTFLKFGHIVTGSNAKSLTYTGSAGSDTAAGLIFCPFRHLK